MRGRVTPPHLRAEVIRLYKDGQRPARIVESLNLSERTVSRILREEGLTQPEVSARTAKIAYTHELKRRLGDDR